MENQLRELANIEGAEINIMWFYKKWHCKVNASHDGVALSISGIDVDMVKAVADCHNKFFRTVQRGCPELSQPVLEYKPD